MEKKEKIMIVSNNEMVNVPRREGSQERRRVVGGGGRRKEGTRQIITLSVEQIIVCLSMFINFMHT